MKKHKLTDLQDTGVMTKSGHGISRRRFLYLGLMTAASSVIPLQALAAVKDLTVHERRLSFLNTHTGESLDSIYWCNGEYLPDELEKINNILRDHRTGDIRTMDTELLDLLCDIRGKLNCDEPLHIISGYRSPKTNALLRKKSKGVARKSMHVLGKAIDIRIPGYDLNVLRRAAYKLRRGGVGLYPRANFVHVDVGRVRYWRG
jgi:uncharacterized protein YcbK (DUF882 family)